MDKLHTCKRIHSSRQCPINTHNQTLKNWSISKCKHIQTNEHGYKSTIYTIHYLHSHKEQRTYLHTLLRNGTNTHTIVIIRDIAKQIWQQSHMYTEIHTEIYAEMCSQNRHKTHGHNDKYRKCIKKYSHRKT